MTTTEINVNDLILNTDLDLVIEIVGIEGRWVKLAGGYKSISRAQAAEWRQAYLDENAEEEEEDEEEEDEGKMAQTLRKYRQGYVKTASYNGNHSLDNGDEVAELLRGMSPQEVCALADKAFGQPEFHHWEKYQSLNVGSRRMNAGNRIRAAVKRGDLTIDDLKAAVAGKDITHDEADV